MYTSEGVTVGPVLYVDDNLTPLSLDTADQLSSILDLYESYMGVSGLNINIKKSIALCVNTPPALCEHLQPMGMSTPSTIKHLGLHLGKTISSTVLTTMAQIEPKAIKRRILATTPPTDVLHRVTLVTTALIPVYNHVFMALPVESKTHREPLLRNSSLSMDQAIGWTDSTEKEIGCQKTHFSRAGNGWTRHPSP
jgi:hypothetical protein